MVESRETQCSIPSGGDLWDHKRYVPVCFFVHRWGLLWMSSWDGLGTVFVGGEGRCHFLLVVRKVLTFHTSITT